MVRHNKKPFSQRAIQPSASDESTRGDKPFPTIESTQYDHIRLNIANGDMVGHTGDLTATIKEDLSTSVWVELWKPVRTRGVF